VRSSPLRYTNTEPHLEKLFASYLLHCALNAPCLLNGQLSDTTMMEAAGAGIGAIYQRNAPDTLFVIVIDDADAKARMVGTIFVYIARRESWCYVLMPLLGIVFHRHLINFGATGPRSSTIGESANVRNWLVSGPTAFSERYRDGERPVMGG
jgi:hypothetical protein